ncbi:hypothetical protein D3C73_920480 [compost metagenome]
MNCTQCGAEDERLATLLVDIGKTQIAAGFGDSRWPPFEEILRSERPLGVDLQLRGNLISRQVKLLGLDPRQCQRLALIQWRLTVGDAMDGASAQQRLTPVHRMAAQASLERHIGHFILAKNEGIHPFAGRSFVIAVCVAAKTCGRTTTGVKVIGGGDAVVVQVTGIGGVVPERGTDPCAVLALVDEI